MVECLFNNVSCIVYVDVVDMVGDEIEVVEMDDVWLLEDCKMQKSLTISGQAVEDGHRARIDSTEGLRAFYKSKFCCQVTM